MRNLLRLLADKNLNQGRALLIFHLGCLSQTSRGKALGTEFFAENLGSLPANQRTTTSLTLESSTTEYGHQKKIPANIKGINRVFTTVLLTVHSLPFTKPSSAYDQRPNTFFIRQETPIVRGRL